MSTLNFTNTLSYDVNVYNSVSSADATDENYYGNLTLITKIPANGSLTGIATPAGNTYAFVFENATNDKPITRITATAMSILSKNTFTVGQADEDAMTQTLKFVDFVVNNPDNADVTAFQKIWQEDPPSATDIDNYFKTRTDAYAVCTYPLYSMALLYTAAEDAKKIDNGGSTATGKTYLLSTLVRGLWGGWPSGMEDVTVSDLEINLTDDALKITMTIEFDKIAFESSDIANNVRQVLGVETTIKVALGVNLQLGLGTFATTLTLSFDNFSIPVDSTTRIPVTNPEAVLSIMPLFKFVTFTLKGTIPLTVDSEVVDLDVALVIDNEELAVNAIIHADSGTLLTLPGLKGVHIDEFGLGLGVFFKPPSCAIGVEGKFHIGEPANNNVIDLDDDSFAIVAKVTGDAVTPQYLSFYIPELSLNQVAEIFTDTKPTFDLPVSFSDLAARWTASFMEPFVLPDGTLSAPGYAFTAAASLFSFNFYGDVSVDLSNLISANLQMSPVSMGAFLQISGDGDGVSIKVDQNGNPIRQNQIRDTQVLQDVLANATDKQMVPAGGPVFKINTTKLPVLQISAKASLLEIANYDIEATIDKDGIKFELDYGIILTTKMVCNLVDFHNFYAEYGYHINESIQLPTVKGVDLGKINLNADIDGHLSVNTTLSDVTVKAGGEFDFADLHFTFGDFKADINIRNMTDFLKAIGAYIVDEAGTIFSYITSNAGKWAEMAGKGLLTAGVDVAYGLCYAFAVTVDAFPQIMKDAGYAADVVAKGMKDIYNATSQAVADALRKVGYTADEVGAAIKNAWNCTINDVSWAMHEVGYSAEDVAGAIKNAFNATPQIVLTALRQWGYSADDIVSSLKDKFGAQSQQVATWLKAAGYTADQVAVAIKAAWNCGINDVSWALQQAGYMVEDIAGAVKTAFNAGLKDVAATLKQWGYNGEEVVKALKIAFNAASQDIAGAMKELGFLATEIGAGIKLVWNCTIDDVSWAMHYAGFTAADTAIAVKNAFNAASQDVAATLKKWAYSANDVAIAIKNAWNCEQGDVIWAMKEVGYTAQDVATAVKNCFDTGAEEILDNLEYFGYDVTEAANAIKSLYNTGVNDMTTLLRVAGFAATDTATALKNIYNTVINDAATGLKEVGYAAQETANALKTAYNATIDQAAAAMKEAGYITTDVASALKSAFNTTAQGVEQAMTDAGYIADDIANAFESLGGDFKSFADKAYDKVKHFFESIF
ncbi:MAG: hypothetical protein QM802_18255 [Agriterribacter sp.]